MQSYDTYEPGTLLRVEPWGHSACLWEEPPGFKEGVIITSVKKDAIVLFLDRCDEDILFAKVFVNERIGYMSLSYLFIV